MRPLNIFDLDKVSLLFDCNEFTQVMSAFGADISDILSGGLEEADDVQSCIEVYLDAPPDSDFRVLAIQKAFTVAKSIEDYKMIGSYAESLFSELLEDSDEPAAHQEIDQQLDAQLDRVRSISGCLRLHKKHPVKGSAFKSKALMKALDMAETIDECKRIFVEAERFSPEAYACIRKAAVFRLNH